MSGTIPVRLYSYGEILLSSTLRVRLWIVSCILMLLVGYSSGNRLGFALARRYSLLTMLRSHETPHDGSGTESGAAVPPQQVFESVVSKIQHEYVWPTNGAELRDGAVSRMVSSLQAPDTQYLNPVQLSMRANQIRGRYEGIGIDTVVKTEFRDGVDFRYLTIRTIAPGSPAERGGLRTGDRIIEVNDRWVIAYAVKDDTLNSEALSSSDRTTRSVADTGTGKPGNERELAGVTAAKAQQILGSGVGTAVRLTIERGSAAPRHVVVPTAVTIVPGVDASHPGPHLLVIQIHRFDGSVGAAVDELLRNTETWSSGLIFDLRQNPGGVAADEHSELNGYGSVIHLLSQFSDSQQAAQVLVHHDVLKAIPCEPTARQYRSRTTGVANHKVPILVLVDEGTSNLAELFASSLRSNAGGSIIVGAQTFGDAQIKWLGKLRGGGALQQLWPGTTGAVGIRPDVAVNNSRNVAGSRRVDEAMAKAIRLAETK